MNCDNFTSPETLELCKQFQTALEAQASDAAKFAETVENDVNVFFLVWAGAMVILMHLGFAMLSAGAVRTKSTSNILLCIVMDMCSCAVAWWLMGYALAYGEDAGNFIGTTYFAGTGIGSDYSYTDWFFQFAFAATAATIVSGAVAERATFESYLTYSFYLSAFVYPIVVHAVWGGGFLSLGGDNSVAGVGALDFAGCGPVHMVGGVAGAAGCYLIGPRMGRFDADGTVLPMPGHSSPLATLGVFILWVGWFAFNGASAITLIGSGVIVERAVVSTLLSSATGGLSALVFTTWMNPGRDWDITMALNGVLAGLVSITSCCPVVETWAALLIGLIGGIVYVLASFFILNKLHLDDPLDAVAVHCCTGMYGLIVTGFFAKTEFIREVGGFGEDVDFRDYSGIFYKGNGKLLGAQITEICFIFPWVLVCIVPYFYMLRKLKWLRISAEDEDIGIDMSSHGGTAYPELYPDTWPVPTKKGQTAPTGEEAPPAADDNLAQA